MDAANTGTATRKPLWMGVRGPNMTQVVKPVSKYRKQASNAFQLPLRRETIKRLIGYSPKQKRHRPVRIAPMSSGRVGSVALLTQQRVSDWHWRMQPTCHGLPIVLFQRLSS